jgi:ribosome-associated protein
MTPATRPPRRAKERASPILAAVSTALEDMKAVNVKVLDVRGVSDFADTLVIASGNSDRHVRSIADRVVAEAKAAGVRPLGQEGTREGEWALVDLQDVVVHVMLPRVREFYGLERLWETDTSTAAPRKRAARAKKAQ